MAKRDVGGLVFNHSLGTVAVFVLLFVAGCGPTKKETRSEKRIASNTHSSISATTNILADGSTPATISIVLKDQNENPMTGLQPVIEVSGTGNNLAACSLTDSQGASTCKLTSTKAEVKTISMHLPASLSTSATFVAGAAAKLGFAVQPSGGTVGDNWVEPPVVEVWDAHDNRVLGSTPNITITLQAGTGTLSGTLTRAAVAGQAKFTGLSLDLVGSDKVLRATSSGLTAADSTVFSIIAASGRSLSFSTQPGGGLAGAQWAQQPVVRILNGGSLDATRTDSITLTLTSGSGSVLGTRTVAAVSGVATFSGLSMTEVGSKVLTASSPGLTIQASNSFSILPAAPAGLIFATQPGGGGAGTVWSQQPVIHIFDGFGNLVTTSTDSIVMSLNSGTGALLGVTNRAASAGVATFTDLKMNISGLKRIRATLGSLNIDSTSFLVGAGAATKLAYATAPGGGVAGVAWTAQPVVEALDSYDNRDTSFGGTIGLSLTAGSGEVTGGTLSLSASSGLATFSGLKGNLAETGKKIRASASGLTAIDSPAFAITHAPAHHMEITAMPAPTGIANLPLSPQPVIKIYDQFNNIVTSGADGFAPVSATLVSGNGQLAGTGTLVAVSGVTTYSGLKFTTPGTKKIRFSKSDTSVIGGTSALFIETSNLEATVGSPAKLAFRTQPGGGTAGVIWLQQPVVEVQDVAGNLVNMATDSVAIAVTNGSMGFLLGTTTAASSAGVAGFSNLKLNVSGAKSLQVSSGTLTAATSATFSVTHNIATELYLKTLAGTAAHSVNFNPATVLEIRDLYENIVNTGADATASVTAELASGTGLLNGVKTLTASSGIVTFGTLSASLIGPKSLKFTKEDRSISEASGVLTVTSGTINITHGAPSKLSIRTQPIGATAGALLLTQPVVEVLDAGNNLITSGTMPTVTVANLTAPTGSVLSGTKALVAASGVVTYTDLSLNKAGAGTVRFTSGTLTSVTSASVTTTHGLATKMSVLTPPSSAIVQNIFGTQPRVEILDAFDNRVTTGPDASAAVTTSLQSGSGNLSGPLTVAAVAGLVTYAGLSIDDVGAKTLRFTKPDLTGGGGTASLTKDSASFTVTPGPGSSLSFTSHPGGGVAGAAWTPAAEVVILDANGFMVTTATNSVTMSLSSGSGVLSGSLTVSAVAGVAKFTNLKINLIGAGKQLSATGAGLFSALSNPFTITTAATDPASTVVASPTSVAGNNIETSTITVTLKDSFGNIANGRSVTLTSSRGGSDSIMGSPATTDASGVASFTVKSNTAGTATFTATEGAVTMTSKPSVMFSDAVMSVAESSWSQDRVSIRNNSSDSVTFSVTIKNAMGDPLSDKIVTLTSSRGGSDIITGSPATTNASGVANFGIKTATLGRAQITVNVDGVTLTDKAEVLALKVLPLVDLQAGFARVDRALLPGSNALSTSSWRETSGNGDNAALTGFAYTTASGWRGDGGSGISGDGNGPYRLGFDGSDDRASFGTVLNSYADISVEMWSRTDSVAQSGRVLFSSADSSLRGLTLRQAGDASKRLEAFVGLRSTYADEVKTDLPAAYLRLNESAGATAYAVLGSNGTYSGSGLTRMVGGALVSNDTAVGFDGSAGSLSLGSALGNTADSSISLEAWIYLDTDVTSTKSIVSKEDSTGYSLEIVNGNYLQMRAYSQALLASDLPTSATGTAALATGVWYHVVGVRDAAQDCAGTGGASAKVYLNGSLEKCEDLSTYRLNATNADMKVGSNPQYAGRNFAGRIDEVAIYLGVLSLARMNAHRTARAFPTCYSSAAIPLSTWFHSVLGHSSGSSILSLAVNGSEVCNLASPASSGGSTAHMAMGAALDSSGGLRAGTSWSGAVGEFRFYTQRLSGTESSNHYSATSAKYP